MAELAWPVKTIKSNRHGKPELIVIMAWPAQTIKSNRHGKQELITFAEKTTKRNLIKRTKEWTKAAGLGL